MSNTDNKSLPSTTDALKSMLLYQEGALVSHHHHNHHCDGHGHHHHHHHHHHHAPASHNAAFAIGVVINFAFVLIEAVYGYLSHSMALFADAGHNLSDVFGLLLAWAGTHLATRKPSKKFTYGYKSSSILAALTNSVLLLLAVGGILWESIQRFANPPAVESSTVMVVAGVGILVNGATALLFMRGRSTDLNLRGAYLHMLSDALVSAGVVAAGVLMYYTQLTWIDPLVSIIISVVIIWGTWSLLKDSLKLALNAVPDAIDGSKVMSYLKNLPGVSEVHDLHIWAMSTTETALTAHMIIPTGHPGNTFLKNLDDHLEHHFGIHHATIQIEMGGSDIMCKLAPDDVV